MLSGYKTYIVGVGAILAAIALNYFGIVSEGQATVMITFGLGIMPLRAGMKTEVANAVQVLMENLPARTAVTTAQVTPDPTTVVVTPAPAPSTSVPPTAA